MVSVNDDVLAGHARGTPHCHPDGMQLCICRKHFASDLAQPFRRRRYGFDNGCSHCLCTRPLRDRRICPALDGVYLRVCTLSDVVETGLPLTQVVVAHALWLVE